MEPLPPALIAGLTPKDVEIHFWDDRMEQIPYDEPTDLVAISVETYTAKRSYQIASEFRKRGIPVVMGGFHATLVPDEVKDYAESVVIGEAENIWPELIADFRAGRLKRIYKSADRPSIAKGIPDRSIYQGKKYLPIALVESARGCGFKCEFCAIQSYFKSTQTHRDIETVIEEIKSLKDKSRLFFFVDDNIVNNQKRAKEFFTALIPLKIKWVSQATMTMVRNVELLKIMKASGCQGVLIGFESLNPDNLLAMNKQFNLAKGGAQAAVDSLNRFGIRLYATFVFGYDFDTQDSFEDTLQFSIRNKIFMLAFNHLTPFPGTPLYERLRKEGKLLYEQWWLDDRYKYGQVPYMTPLDSEYIKKKCVESRKRFYHPMTILRRLSRTNLSNLKMLRAYFFINFLLFREASQREDYPLGDLSFKGPLIKVKEKIAKAQSIADIGAADDQIYDLGSNSKPRYKDQEIFA
jgi:radical SAM superfamily enzyme YgiQ (UPF0313 family)